MARELGQHEHATDWKMNRIVNPFEPWQDSQLGAVTGASRDVAGGGVSRIGGVMVVVRAR